MSSFLNNSNKNLSEDIEEKGEKTVLSNFDRNLLEASLEKEDLIKAKEEWEVIRTEKSTEKKICICNHKILNVIYYINKYNGNIICCGSICTKKFNLEKKEISNKTLEKIFKLKKPYNEYKQFSNIQEYLDYAKDELNNLISKEIELSKFNNLINLLEDINNINKLNDLNFFNVHIESIKTKIVQLIPNYIESELRNDITSIFQVITKLSKLSNDYTIQKTDISIFKRIIEKIVDNHIVNYCGYNTPPYQKKFDEVINKIEYIKKNTGKTLLLKEFLVTMNDKLKAKIQSIRNQNEEYDRAKYERRKKYEQTMRERYPKKYYF